MIDGASRRKFFPLAHRAWLAHALRNDIDERDRQAEDTWRRDEMEDVVRCRSTKDLDPVKGMDTIMLHWAKIIGDDREIEYWATAPERRMRRRIRIAMDRLAHIEQRPVTWNYCRSIASHMNIPEDLNDCPAALLWKVYQALDTHIRRLQRKQGAHA